MTTLIVANYNLSKGSEDFGFHLVTSRVSSKKKDREKECLNEMNAALDVLPMSDAKAWSQMPIAKDAKKDVETTDSEQNPLKQKIAEVEKEKQDLERIQNLVGKRFPKASVEMGMPTATCLVGAAPWAPSNDPQLPDPELAVLDRFEPGFADLFREARRCNGLVRKQWYLASVWVKTPSVSNNIPFALGWGFSTDWNVAKVRAVHAAEIRVPILTEAMLTKATKP